jgi:Trk K+ transport system NAD-binding subunit
LNHFKSLNVPAVGIDINPDRVKEMLDEGCRVLYADAQDAFFWEELDMAKLQAILIAMSGEIHTKEYIIKQLRKKNFTGPIRVLTQNEREDELVLNAGAEPVSVPSVQMGQKMAELSLG